MRYLVDTDRVADFLAGRGPGVRIIQPLLHAGDDLAISLVTYGEIYEGIRYGRDPTATEAGFRALLRAVDVLPLNRAIMRRFADLRGQLRRSGQVIGDFDTLIAATALHHGRILITGNLAHFQRIPGLALHQPTP